MPLESLLISQMLPVCAATKLIASYTNPNPLYCIAQTREDAEKAIGLIHGKDFEGLKLEARFAKKGGVLGSSAKRRSEGESEGFSGSISDYLNRFLEYVYAGFL